MMTMRIARPAGALLLLLGVLSSQSGCGIAYHRTFHHRSETTGPEPVTERTLISSIPEANEIRGAIDSEPGGRSVLRVDAVVRTRQAWEIREGEKWATAEVCDGRTWDHYLFWLTLGMPFLMAEYLLIVPAVAEDMHDRMHALPSRSGAQFRREFRDPARRVEEVRDVRAPFVDVAVTLLIGSEVLRLGVVRTGPGTYPRLPLFGAGARPLPEMPPTLLLEGSWGKDPWASTTLVPEDPAAFVACLQGARWDAQPSSGDAGIVIRSSARVDPVRNVVVATVALKNPSESPLRRVGVRGPGGLVFYLGTIDAGQESQARFEVPYEDRSSVTLECFEAAGRVPVAVTMMVDGVEEQP